MTAARSLGVLRRITVPHIRPLRSRSLIEHRYNNIPQPESVLATTVMALWVQYPFPASQIHPPPPGRSRLRRAATSAHPFPAIFGNFHPFMWPNNTGQPKRAAILKGNFAFSLGKNR